MLTLKTLFATAMLSGAAVISYAQAPGHPVGASTYSPDKANLAQPAKGILSTGMVKSHAKKHKKPRHQAMQHSRPSSAKKSNNPPIGLQAY